MLDKCKCRRVVTNTRFILHTYTIFIVAQLLYNQVFSVIYRTLSASRKRKGILNPPLYILVLKRKSKKMFGGGIFSLERFFYGGWQYPPSLNSYKHSQDLCKGKPYRFSIKRDSYNLLHLMRIRLKSRNLYFKLIFELIFTYILEWCIKNNTTTV